MMETDISTKNEMAGSTQVLNEAGVKTVVRHARQTVPMGLMTAARVGYDQSSIYDFLEKPILLQTVSWAAQAAGDVLINKSLPQDAFSSAIYSNKIDGFLAFRGTTVLRLQVNGNKFQAGRLLMVFIPQGNVASSWPGMRIRSLTAATQLPRVELDLASETEVIMEVPYISPTPFYNFNDSTGPIGRVVVLVYSPVATGTGSTAVDISLWVNFTEVELSAPAVAQMNDLKPRKRFPKKKNPSEHELSAYGDTPISSTLSSLASAASSFAKIPYLESVAGPASWVLNCLSGAASAFGYSKPGTEEATTKVMTLHNFNTANCNGVDMYPNLGLDGTNKMSIMPGYGGTQLDEMALTHLFQIPSYITSFSYGTSGASGDVLYSADVFPRLGTTNGITNLWVTRDMTPLGYFSSFFDLWRGSIVFTFKVIKTSFHSGRLLIAYNPAPVSPTLSQTNYLLREIVDIRETSEFRFVIPYVATTQYKKTGGFTGTAETIGKLRVFILNDLVAPSTVANSVQVLVEVSGGPDFEVACPLPYSVAPLIVSTWSSQMADVVPPQKESDRPDKNQGLVAIGSASVPQQDLDPAVYCIGEKVNSILQLMKRYSVLNYFATDTPVTNIAYRPFTYGTCYSTDPITTTDIPTGDFISMFGPCFAYSRGSVRISFVPPSNNSYVGTCVNVVAYPDTDNTVISASPSLPNKRPGVAINFQPNPSPTPVGATIPPYQQLHCRLNRPSTSVASEPVDVYTSAMKVGCTTVLNTSTDTARIIYRAAADDFGLGYFIGVPLITTSVTY